MPSFQVAYSLDQSFLNFKETVNLLGDSVVKNLPANAGDMGSILGHEDSLKEEMATHSGTLAWRIPTDKGSWWAISPWGSKESDTAERLKQ